MTAIVLVKDAALASSLEAVLVADGLRVIVQDPQSPLQALPLAEGRLLVSEHRMLPFHLAEFLTAVGRITDRVVAVDGVPAVRPTCILTLSLDHRAVDGAAGARFLDTFASLVEDPTGLVR